MLWDVWIVDYVERTCEIVVCSVSMSDAKDFQSVWTDANSLVVILPFGFEICRI